VVEYSLASAGPVRLDLRTAYGALIAHIVQGRREVGSHAERIDLVGRGVPVGTFLVTIQAAGTIRTKSITMAREIR